MRSLRQATDDQLIAATLANEHSAFAELVRRYEGIVAATVIGMLGPGDDADEVGQETMIKLYRSLSRFKGDAQLKTYITRIAINTSLDALRRRKRNLLRFFTTDNGDTSWENQLPDSNDHIKDYEHRQLIQQALSQLKPDFRAVAVLRLMQGHSTEEVATILGIAQGTVLSRLSRAKQQLATILKPEMNYA